ncbi:MAG: SH3 domain-containing protein [Lachnospiraceae bacterium]|nr:SH3 domain-containing protein [Lachnospiraceae bacterium]
MKKLLAGLLSITLILGHASCNKAPASVQTSTTVSSISSVSVSEPKPELEPEPVPEPTPAPAPEPESKPADTPADNSAEGTGIETGTEDPWTFTDMDTVKYAKTRVNVRDLPGIDGKKLGVLNQNDRVHITGRCNETGWYRFEYKDGIGYSHGDYFVNEKVNVQVNVETKNDNAAQDSQSSGNTSGGSQSGGNQNIPALIGSYPNPATLSLSVTPITKANYATYITSVPADLDEYKADTVFGFVVRPNGLNSLLNLFDRIEFYAYDAQYYASAMQPISSALASSNPSSGTTLTSVSNEGQPDVQGKTYFYPATDNNFAAKVSINLKRTSDNALLSDPRAIFLFDDFTGNKAACESALLSRTSGLAGTGYTVNTVVSDTFANGVFFRGRDYEFTFRLHVDQNEVQDAIDRMYPEVLGENIACILKAPAVSAAPYEEPAYYFYPADKDANALTYGYYIQAKDGNSIFSGVNMVTTVGNVGSTPKNNPGGWINTVISNEDAKVRVNNLHENDQVSVSFVERRYVPAYNRSRTVTAFTRILTEMNGVPRCTFSVTPDDASSTVGFDLTFNTAAMAKSVVAVEGIFQKADHTADTHTIRLSNISVSGVTIHGTVSYADLDEVRCNSGIEVRLRIYYDTGREGLLTGNFSADTSQFVCIREAGESSAGQYFIPVGGGADSRFQNKNQNAQDINAEGSFFRLRLLSDSDPGTQIQDIAGTLSSAPGKVNVLISDYDENNLNGFQYTTGSTARARLGGMYDANIAGNQLNFTVSLVANTATAQGVNSNSDTEIFEIQGNSGP